MGPGEILRELRAGLPPAARTGLFALALGAVMVAFVVVMLSPRVGGLVSLPGHELERPVASPRVARVAPKLTAAQKRVARATAIRVAALQVGVREHGGENRGDRIKMYRRAVTGPGEKPWKAEPWCADFVSWAWKRAGVPIGFGGRGSDYVPELSAWAQLTHRWKWARTGYRPKAGDLVVYRVSGVSRRGHIGLVVRTKRGKIRTIEGNYEDRVARRIINPRHASITGFIVPV